MRSTAIGSPSSGVLSRLDTLPDYIPELTLGWEAAKWTAKYLKQPNGARAGERYQLTDRQLMFLLHWYAVDEDGRWRYYHGVRRLSKGQGKSPFAAVMSLVEFCAPVRLLDFDPRRPGGCVGKPVHMPMVQISAVSEEQTKNTMRMVRAFAPKGSRVVDEYGLDPGLTRYYRRPEGTLEVITSSAHSAEGNECTFVVADETEWWLPAQGGPHFHSTLLGNLAKSGSRMLETSNAWVPGTGSVAEDTWDSFVLQEEGKSRNEQRILYDARMAPPDTVLSDPESLKRALDWVYADCWWADTKSLMTQIYHPKAKVDESRRKFLNWPTSAEDSWVRRHEWLACHDPDRAVKQGERVVMFFDGSLSRDATALVGCCVSDGHVFKIGLWEPDNGHDGGRYVDAEVVDARVEWAFEHYDVVGFFADVREWEGFTKVTWPQRYRDRLQIMAVPGGKHPEPIAWDMRSKSFDFTMAAELVEAEIREGKFTHDGDDALTRHIINARRAENRYGISVRKETPNSPDKIDGAVCVIGARMVWRLLTASNVKERSNEAFFL